MKNDFVLPDVCRIEKDYSLLNISLFVTFKKKYILSSIREVISKF